MNDYVMRVLIRSVSHAFLQIKDCSLKISEFEVGQGMEKNS